MRRGRDVPFAAMLCAALSFPLVVQADDAPLVGRWQTISDVTGKPAGIVEIYEQSGVYRGRVAASFDAAAGAVCLACTDARKGQPIVGLEILTGLHRDGNVFSGGEILDPENGRVYRAKLALDPDGKTLNVRGYVGLPVFGRSQVWHKVP